MRKAIYILLAVLLVFSQASTLQIFFDLFDQNADSYLTQAEIVETIWRLESNDDTLDLNNIPYALHEIVQNDFMNTVDHNKDNLISYSEWENKFSLLNSQDGPEQVHLALGNSISVISVIWVTKCTYFKNKRFNIFYSILIIFWNNSRSRQRPNC